MGTARTSEHCVKMKFDKSHDFWKHHETEDGGDLFKTYSSKKREITFTKPLHIRFTIYQLKTNQSFLCIAL